MNNYIKLAYWAFMHRILSKDTPAKPADVFTKVYRDRVWGGEDAFNSGVGSRDRSLVDPYIAAVKHFLGELPTPACIVDLGCGDFQVGQHLVPFARNYIACDIVEAVIEHNQKKFVSPNLQFQVINAIEDELPKGDIVCVRQVLQHLSNEHIAKILPKLGSFQHWIITEHLPANPLFVPNRDKKTGGDIRIRHLQSGVVITAPPFSVSPKAQRVLCEVSCPSGDQDAIIRTIVYSF